MVMSIQAARHYSMTRLIAGIKPQKNTHKKALPIGRAFFYLKILLKCIDRSFTIDNNENQHEQERETSKTTMCRYEGDTNENTGTTRRSKVGRVGDQRRRTRPTKENLRNWRSERPVKNSVPPSNQDPAPNQGRSEKRLTSA